MSRKRKFYLTCSACKEEIGRFSHWFQYGQCCPACWSGQAEVIYKRDMSLIKRLIKEDLSGSGGLWRYFDFLPVNFEKNVVSCGEGVVPIDRWLFLERFARGALWL